MVQDCADQAVDQSYNNLEKWISDAIDSELANNDSAYQSMMSPPSFLSDLFSPEEPYTPPRGLPPSTQYTTPQYNPATPVILPSDDFRYTNSPEY